MGLEKERRKQERRSICFLEMGCITDCSKKRLGHCRHSVTICLGETSKVSWISTRNRKGRYGLLLKQSGVWLDIKMTFPTMRVFFFLKKIYISKVDCEISFQKVSKKSAGVCNSLQLLYLIFFLLLLLFIRVGWGNN